MKSSAAIGVMQESVKSLEARASPRRPSARSRKIPKESDDRRLHRGHRESDERPRHQLRVGKGFAVIAAEIRKWRSSPCPAGEIKKVDSRAAKAGKGGETATARGLAEARKHPERGALAEEPARDKRSLWREEHGGYFRSRRGDAFVFRDGSLPEPTRATTPRPRRSNRRRRKSRSRPPRSPTRPGPCPTWRGPTAPPHAVPLLRGRLGTEGGGSSA